MKFKVQVTVSHLVMGGELIANGSIQNKGLEVLVSGVPIQTDDFPWSTSFNFSHH